MFLLLANTEIASSISEYFSEHILLRQSLSIDLPFYEPFYEPIPSPSSSPQQVVSSPSPIECSSQQIAPLSSPIQSSPPQEATCKKKITRTMGTQTKKVNSECKESISLWGEHILKKGCVPLLKALQYFYVKSVDKNYIFLGQASIHI